VQSLEVPADEGLLLLSSPLLDLALSRYCCLEVAKLLGMNQNDRTSARSVRATFACLMIGDTAGKVSGGSDVKRVIAA
jgi:hypothetical protein